MEWVRDFYHQQFEYLGSKMEIDEYQLKLLKKMEDFHRRFNILLLKANLSMSMIISGGEMDYITWEYYQKVPLEEARSYTCFLTK